MMDLLLRNAFVLRSKLPGKWRTLWLLNSWQDHYIRSEKEAFSVKEEKSRSIFCINLIEHCIVVLWQWLILDYLEMSRTKIISQFVVNITHKYRMYYPGSNTRMSPWLCYCLQCIHGLNLYIPDSYLPLLLLTAVITSSILFEKAATYIYTWQSNPGGW